MRGTVVIGASLSKLHMYVHSSVPVVMSASLRCCSTSEICTLSPILKSCASSVINCEIFFMPLVGAATCIYSSAVFIRR